MQINRMVSGMAVMLSLTFFISSCSSVPEHTRFIPKDAVVVVGVNTKGLSKKIAWNALMGSKILKKLKKQQTKDAAQQLDQAGIETMSTSYLYITSGSKPTDNNRITALVPLEDAAKWESFVKQVFPQASIKSVNNRKEALLSDGMYAGWNNDLLVVLNVIPGQDEIVNTISAISQDSAKVDSLMALKTQVDAAQLSAEMQKAFSVTKENSVVTDNRFSGLAKQGHDISLWVNYDVLMSNYGAMASGMLPNITSSLWKGSAFTAGFDFQKGKIVGDMQYFVSDVLKEAAKELGKENVDKEMLNRLPAQNLNMLMAWHLAPKGIKIMLEKTGLLGIANIGLASQGISFDDVLDAFTGDMVVGLNDFSLKQAAPTDSSNLNLQPQMNFVYALKINKKEAFNKLLQFATNRQVLSNDGNNIYKMPGTDESAPLMMIDDHYLVVANTATQAQAYLQGKYKGEPKASALKSEVYGHPFGAFFDMQSIARSIDIPAGTSRQDSLMIVQSKNLLSHLAMNGGEFRNNASVSHLTIQFKDESENSLLQLIGFAMDMQAAKEENNAVQASLYRK